MREETDDLDAMDSRNLFWAGFIVGIGVTLAVSVVVLLLTLLKMEANMGKSQSFETKIRSAMSELVEEFIAKNLAPLIPDADPFLIEHDCLNPAGHRFIGSCGDVVCVHCAKVVWS